MTRTQLDAMADQLGIPLDSPVRALAENILNNGQECDRCHVIVEGEGLMYMFAFYATTPCMPNPSPPSMLCGECGYRAAAFMGVEAAQKILDERYGG